jgi:hypothetical protein
MPGLPLAAALNGFDRNRSEKGWKLFQAEREGKAEFPRSGRWADPVDGRLLALAGKTRPGKEVLDSVGLRDKYMTGSQRSPVVIYGH